MDIMITTTIFLSVLQAAICFNIDPVAWRSLENNAASFGYRVVQRRSDVLVSAPLAQSSPTGRGQIFSCSPRWGSTCRELSIQPPVFAVNMSLGLTMASDPYSSKSLVCGPTIPKDCQSITMYNGLCMEISNIVASPPVPSSPQECRTQADIAFLLDGSGSVDRQDFERMKTFVMDMVKSFTGKDTQFAIAQFATGTTIHYFFDTFNVNNMQAQMNTITQLRGRTYTAAAIRSVVNNIFSGRGSRDKVRKVLIVITDGQSNDRVDLESSANLAQSKSIVRFAIGVGNAFSIVEARQELDTIASDPAANHVFRVGSFEALENIRKALQEKIFSIEGSTTGGGSLEMEMAQEGFSAAYVPGVGFQMGMVGANNWKGGYQTYANNIKSGSYEPDYIEPDSYLGYSMAVALTRYGSLTIVGAPRYQHRGIVMTVQTNGRYKKIDPFPWQFQSGEYFGAEVCAMDVDRDAYTDLILISAPMYMDDDREGRVYACILTKLDVDCQFGDSPVVLSGIESDNGRFGSSLAVLPDLNSDGLNDLAVGAPLENDNQGSIYIFHGEQRGRLSLAYSQRIAGSEVAPGLKFFGTSISQSSFDQSGDSLTDLAVGSKGKVVLLRSKPIVMVEAKVSFNPSQIPTQNSDCTKPLNSVAEICLTMSRHSSVDTARARINCTFTLDATRKIPNNRAYFSEKQRVGTKSVDISLGRVQCFSMNFLIDPCPEDALNSLNNELQLNFEGLPSDDNLRPSLAEQAQTTTFHPLGFEINCGADEKCVDNLKVDFNFTSSSEVKVGIDELLDVTVSVENRGENAYNSRVILTYPAGLSFRKFTILQGRIECNSLDSEDDRSRGKTDCSINKPIFKSDAKVLFIVSYGVEAISQVDRKIYVTANATSGNQEHSPASDLYKKKFIDVKYSIFVTIDSSLSYNNFTFGKNDLQKPVDQSIKVTNDIRALNFTVVIKVPIKLGDKDIWVDSRSLQIPDCQRDRDEEPGIKDFVPQIQKNKLVDCSVAWCSVFKCERFMEKLESKQYKISANLSSRWLEQIGLKAAKYLLTSTASLEYDRNQYIFFSIRTNNNPPIRKIEAEVEVYPEPDFTKEIVGGTLGGLALLALLTAGLYKAGFFKSKYKEMMDTGGEAADADAGEPTQE